MVAAALLLASLATLTACRGAAPADDFAAGSDARRFDIEGKVIAVDKPGRQITLAHGEVKGFMDAMTMPFLVKEAWAFDAAAPGDSLRGTLVVDGARAWIEGVNVTRTNTAAVSPTKASWAPAEPGTPTPDVTLTDQDGRPLRLARWRGHAYVLTFSFTRCPLEEFCPLMMQRFAAIEKAIAADTALGGVRLLTVTLDPEHDSPARLRAYGAKYASGAGPSQPFTRWSLVTGTPAQIKPLAGFFGLDYYTETTGQVIHSLRTAVIDREGRVAEVFESNTWKTDQVVEALRAATTSATATEVRRSFTRRRTPPSS
jgi:protein SCO1